MNSKAILMGTVLIVCFALLGSNLASSQEPQKKPEFKMKISEMSPPLALSCRVLDWWASEIEKRTNGRVKFDRYWSGSLVGAYEQLDSMKVGVADIGVIYSGYHPNNVPFLRIGTLPMVHRGSIKQALLASDDLCRNNRSLQAEFEKNNLKYMLQVLYGNHYIFARFPLNTLDDLKGRTIRSYGPHLAFLKEFGCGLVSLPVPEVYESIERGVVDGTTQYLSLGISGRYYEVCKYLNTTELGHNVGCPAAMNLDRWKKLPKDIQGIIEDVNAEAVGHNIRIHSEINQDEMNVVKSKGVIISQFPPNDVKRLVEVADTKIWKPYGEELDKKGLPGTEVMKEYLRLIDKYAEK